MRPRQFEPRLLHLLVDGEADELRPFRELQRAGEVPLGEVEPVLVEQGPDEVHRRARGILDVVYGERDLGRLDELGDPGIVGPEHERGAVVVQGVREHPVIPGLPRDLDRATRQLDRAIGVVRQQGELRLVAQCHRVQARVARVGEHRGCLAGRDLGVGTTAAEPLEAREPPQARAEPEGFVELPSQRDGLGLRDHRVARRTDGVRLDRGFLEQIGQFGRLESVGVRSGRPVVRGRLPVRTRRGGIPRRPRRPLDDRVDVTRRERMVHQPRRVGDARREQFGEHTAFEFDATRRGQGVDDRASGELVAELHAVGADVEQASLLSGAEGALRPRAPAERAGRGRPPRARRRVARRDPASRSRGGGGARSPRRPRSAAPLPRRPMRRVR